MISDHEQILRLLLAVVLGGIVGIERESLEKPAGFRAHILVALGAAMFAIAGVFWGSPAIHASVVVVVGFLGAATIWRHGTADGGLTTAASLWTVAAIGMAVGTEFYTSATVATALVIVILHLFSRVGRRVPRRADGHEVLTINAIDQPGLLGRIGATLGHFRANIEGIEMLARVGGRVQIEFKLRIPTGRDRDQILMAAQEMEGIETVSWARSD
ncbi:MAG: MgtC/SapB family protein [Armatimonadetes bacterium]|nr:MgtC/SapB family protein [Armatimonadota bacterium]